MGRDYYEPFGLEPQEVVGRAITHLIRKKVPRQTEGAAALRPHDSRAVHRMRACTCSTTLPWLSVPVGAQGWDIVGDRMYTPVGVQLQRLDARSAPWR